MVSTMVPKWCEMDFATTHSIPFWKLQKWAYPIPPSGFSKQEPYLVGGVPLFSKKKKVPETYGTYGHGSKSRAPSEHPNPH